MFLCQGFRNSGDKLSGSQAALTSGRRDKSDFPLGGQDSNPVHAPPPDFGPDARLDSGVECRSLEAAGKASGGLEPRKFRKVSLLNSSKPTVRVAGSPKMLDGVCLAGIPTGRVESETTLRTAKLLAG